MKKLFDYQTVQNYLIRYYEKNGTFSTVKEILPEIKEYHILGDGDIVPRPQFYDWNINDTGQLMQLYNHCYLEHYRVTNEIDHWISDHAYQARIMCNLIVFMHFSHHRAELRRKDVLEFCYVLDGGADLYQEEETIHLKKGDIAVIGGKNIHDITASPQSTVLGFQIGTQVFQKLFRSFLEQDNFLVYLFHQFLYTKDSGYYILHIEPDPEIKMVIRSLLSEFNPYLQYANMICKDYIEVMFYKILQNYSSRGTKASMKKTAPYLIFPEMINMIYQDNEISLQAIAKRYHYNESYLSRLIRQKTGESFSDIVARIRLCRSKHLLAYTQLPISEIAGLSGYPSHNQFSRSFRCEMGITPSAYRKQMSKNASFIQE